MKSDFEQIKLRSIQCNNIHTHDNKNVANFCIYPVQPGKSIFSLEASNRVVLV
jgi:hypothetical protein